VQLSIRNLSKTYANGVQALKSISLDISPGMFGLLGPNGAGKSTLMRTLATLQEPDSGSILLGSIDVLADRDGIRRVLGYLPQEFGAYPKVSAVDLLNHFALLKGLTEQRQRKQTVERLLHLTNLWEVRKKALSGFSGGMRQRFGIAQALLGEPKLIIVDEPTAGLDPEERVRFHNLLSEIGEDVVVILSTHIVGDVADLRDHLAVIHKGQLLLSGRPEAQAGLLEGKLWRTMVPKDQMPELEQRYSVVSSRLIRGQQQVHVIHEHRPDENFQAQPPELEDIYFAAG